MLRLPLLNGVSLGADLTRLVQRRGGRYLPMLEHVARRRGRRELVVRVRRPRRAVPPVLTPGQIELICDACAIWDADARRWRGAVRDRLLGSVLAETGMHPNVHQTPVSAQYARDALDLAEALFDHVYVVTKRFKEFRERRAGGSTPS